MSVWKTSNIFAVEEPVNGKVLVQRNVLGWYPADKPEVWEAIHRVQTKQETAAALAGSMFGWDVTAANPDAYDDEGRPVSTSRRRQRMDQTQLLQK